MTDSESTDVTIGAPSNRRAPALVGVSFRRGGKVYHFASGGVRVSTGDHVLARTEKGVDLGEVVMVKDTLEPGDCDKPLKPLVRRATRDDLRREERLREREKEAFAVCERKIAEHGLPMKLIEADYTFDGQRLVFFFSSETRVDFRALVKDLAETFHCRIELRQIGVRDEAKMVGGLGPCGRPLCCAQWLRSFDPVGIKVAKDQGMSLNPAKISGICDRLMCCLKYEHEVYKDLAARMPQVGDEVRGQGRVGRVKSVVLLREKVIVDMQEGDTTQTLEVTAQDLRRARGHWLLIGSSAPPPAVPPPTSPAEAAAGEVRAYTREPQRDRRRRSSSNGDETPAEARPAAPIAPVQSRADAGGGAPTPDGRRPRSRRRAREAPASPPASAVPAAPDPPEAQQPCDQAPRERAARRRSRRHARRPADQPPEALPPPASPPDTPAAPAQGQGHGRRRPRSWRRRPRRGSDATLHPPSGDDRTAE